MSNFEEKFNNWQRKMNQKSDREKHNYALTVALFITAIVFFFVASRWYFEISGRSVQGSLVTDVEGLITSQKQKFIEKKQELAVSYKQLMDAISGSETVTVVATTSQATTTQLK